MKVLFLLALLPMMVSANVGFEAYKVNIDKAEGASVRFADGSDAVIFGEPPVEIDYLDSVVVYRDNSDWFMCFDGDRFSLSNIDLPLNKDKRSYLDLSHKELISIKEC